MVLFTLAPKVMVVEELVSGPVVFFNVSAEDKAGILVKSGVVGSGVDRVYPQVLALSTAGVPNGAEVLVITGSVGTRGVVGLGEVLG